MKKAPQKQFIPQKNPGGRGGGCSLRAGFGVLMLSTALSGSDGDKEMDRCTGRGAEQMQNPVMDSVKQRGKGV